MGYLPAPKDLLTECVMNHTKILIDIGGRGNKKLIAKVISFDHHFNMVLTNVVEKWTEKRGGVLEHKAERNKVLISILKDVFQCHIICEKCNIQVQCTWYTGCAVSAT